MNLSSDPWIPIVWNNGAPGTVSLNDAFLRGHDIRDLAVRPHERIALMRLLPNNSALERGESLVAFLRSLNTKGERGAISNLRCLLTEARHHRGWPLLARFGGIGDANVETIAGLFAYHPEGEGDRRTSSFGETCRLIADQSRRDDGTSTFDVRFTRLLNCSQSELRKQLRSVVFAAKAKGVPVNYAVLYQDLWFWDANDRARTRWAQAYWRASAASEGQNTPATAEVA